MQHTRGAGWASGGASARDEGGAGGAAGGAAAHESTAAVADKPRLDAGDTFATGAREEGAPSRGGTSPSPPGEWHTPPTSGGGGGGSWRRAGGVQSGASGGWVTGGGGPRLLVLA